MDSIIWELRNVIAYRNAFRHASHIDLSFFLIEKLHFISSHTQYIHLLGTWKFPSLALSFLLQHVRSITTAALVLIIITTYIKY